jgi:anti-sigma factor RsiW
MNGNHCSDEQLIQQLYGVGPSGRHLAECAECQARLDAMRLSRREVEDSYRAEDALSQESFAAQRRAIYARIEARESRLWWTVSGRAWASAALAVVLLGGGWAIHSVPYLLSPNGGKRPAVQNKLSDAELADQVSQIADNAEPKAAAPLEALFED